VTVNIAVSFSVAKLRTISKGCC